MLPLPTLQGKGELVKKYEEGSNYMECMIASTVKQNRLIEMIGPVGLKQSRKTQTILPTCQEEICQFGFNVICRDADGACFLSKQGSGREHINHPQDLNLLTGNRYNQHG
jgi:hypothetical protein